MRLTKRHSDIGYLLKIHDKKFFVFYKKTVNDVILISVYNELLHRLWEYELQHSSSTSIDFIDSNLTLVNYPDFLVFDLFSGDIIYRNSDIIHYDEAFLIKKINSINQTIVYEIIDTKSYRSLWNSTTEIKSRFFTTRELLLLYTFGRNKKDLILDSFSLFTGDAVWSVDLTEYATPSYQHDPTNVYSRPPRLGTIHKLGFYDDMVIIQLKSGKKRLIGTKNGVVKWAINGAGREVVFQDQRIVSFDGKYLKLINPQNGEIYFDKEVKQEHPPLVDLGHRFNVFNDEFGFISSDSRWLFIASIHDLNNRQILDMKKVTGKSIGISNYAILGNELYVSDGSGDFYVFDKGLV